MNGSSKAPLHSSPPLPLIKTFDEAVAFGEKEKDPFYLAAFLIQIWLGGLVQRAAAEYAEKKDPKERSLQNGEAWRAFREIFVHTPDQSPRFLLSQLCRFSVSDDSPGNFLRRALFPLSVEHYAPSEGPASEEEGDDSARSTLIRWCDWLDAAIHLHTHQRWHTVPAACFDPDPETRELAALGYAQRHLAHLTDRAKACWLADFAGAAEHYKDSPKWAALGKAMSPASDRPWPYAEVDTLILSLWPLVKAYNWTYRDLLNVIRPALKRPQAYPCGREQDFAAYCPNVLGLRKQGRGTTAKNGRPAGYEIAKQICPALSAEGPSSTKP